MSWWTSVTDKMPDDGIDVLVWCTSNGDDWFQSIMHALSGIFFDYNVTHWMPLPEPPEVAK
jgi:hypothetical protein